jgi:cation:H+ antiporter
MKNRFKYLLCFIIAAIATIPGIYMRTSGMTHHALAVDGGMNSVIMVTVLAGVAILGASFLLLWACDAAQSDISQTLALAVLALVAVLPEYAVDMYFTWQAGQFPDGDYAHYAIANMTGANRLLIGVGWSAIAIIYWIRTRKPIILGAERRTELFFLGIATLYAFVIPIKGTLEWYDGLVFLGIYAWYIVIASKRPVEEPDIEGPADLVIRLPKQKRRLVTLSLFLFAGFTIFTNAEPFSEGLLSSGKLLHINEFLLVQWLAPIASEAPEFIVAIIFTLRGQASMALGSLLSSKLNQWTLLVGMIPAVYAISAQTFAHPIPMNSFQMNEILLTAAQSVMAVLILSGMRLSVSQAILIFTMFIGQFVAPMVVKMNPVWMPLKLEGEEVHKVFSIMYVWIAVAVYLDMPERLSKIWRGIQIHFREPESKLTITSDRVVETLIAELRDRNSIVRAGAVEALGKIGSQRAMDAILMELKDENPNVRIRAIDVLGRSGELRFLNALLDTFNVEKDSRVIAHLVEAFGDMGDIEAVDELITAVKDKDSVVRIKAVEALTKIECDNAIEALISLIWDSDSHIQDKAAEALGKIGNEKVIEAMYVALKDKDPQVRKLAAEALGKIGNEKAIGALLSVIREKNPEEKK